MDKTEEAKSPGSGHRGAAADTGAEQVAVWELIKESACDLEPVLEELGCQSVQGELLHIELAQKRKKRSTRSANFRTGSKTPLKVLLHKSITRHLLSRPKRPVNLLTNGQTRFILLHTYRKEPSTRYRGSLPSRVPHSRKPPLRPCMGHESRSLKRLPRRFHRNNQYRSS